MSEISEEDDEPPDDFLPDKSEETDGFLPEEEEEIITFLFVEVDDTIVFFPVEVEETDAFFPVPVEETDPFFSVPEQECELFVGEAARIFKLFPSEYEYLCTTMTIFTWSHVLAINFPSGVVACTLFFPVMGQKFPRNIPDLVQKILGWGTPFASRAAGR
jgi:hypothetical protein